MERYSPAGQSAATHLDIAVDSQRGGRPIISHSTSAGDMGASALRPENVGAVDARRPAPGEIDDADLARSVEVGRGPSDRIANGARDRTDRGFRRRRERLSHPGEHRRVEPGAVGGKI